MQKSEEDQKSQENELPIVQKAYDLIKWFVPILNRLPRNHKFGLGERIVSQLYDILEGLVLARYAKDKQHKLDLLQPLSGKLDLLTYQTRLLFDFKLMNLRRYEYASSLLDELACIIHERIEKKPESLMLSRIWRFDPNNSLYFLSITNY